MYCRPSRSSEALILEAGNLGNFCQSCLYDKTVMMMALVRLYNIFILCYFSELSTTLWYSDSWGRYVKTPLNSELFDKAKNNEERKGAHKQHACCGLFSWSNYENIT